MPRVSKSRARGGLRVLTRPDREGLWIVGTPFKGAERVRRRAASDDPKLAREEAAALHAKILRTAWHGERRGTRSFAEAVLSYLKAEPRAEGDKRRLNRILVALGDVPLSAVTQEAVDRVRDKMLAPDASPATVRRGVIAPIRAVLRHAARRGWCERPDFEIPREGEGRTRFLLPAEADRLVGASAAHLKPLLVFLLCTGARLGEALDLDWREVDLVGRRATLWTKGRPRRRRVVELNGRVVAALAALSFRDGPVFRWETKRPTKPGRDGKVKRDGKPKRVAAYADRQREGGGQISTGWEGALRRAGLDPELTPHDLRHTWASWHYALHRDLLKLQEDGQWSKKSLDLVRRYTHLLPAGLEAEIRAFWHLSDPNSAAELATA